ncbi:MAG TPA: GNAT family N-acetyltransferase [Pseudolabrys sp.]|jgi:predicted GNAT family acetyltransferase|nr:GNAT family N-acetyltransferase [Pseudolabrys sp.]
MTSNVRDNADRHRFELDADGHIAFSNYKRAEGVLTILHTEVPKALEGRGIGSALIRGVLDIARSQRLKVIAVCPFAKSYIERHPEYADLLQ